MIKTARLKLVPGTVELARAELGDTSEFARVLAATVPENWPPESVVDALPLFLSWLEAAPESVGWFGWYALAQMDDAEQPTLVGGGGFLGLPQNGRIQTGYSVLPQFQRRGFATELVRGLMRWAFQQPGVLIVEAETEWANPASVGVLKKVGFQQVGERLESGAAKFELRCEEQR
jgi:[ribosomal protein S5]-alanine N-acetyltransferase